MLAALVCRIVTVIGDSVCCRISLSLVASDYMRLQVVHNASNKVFYLQLGLMLKTSTRSKVHTATTAVGSVEIKKMQNITV